MPVSVTKKVRLSPERARLLARLARESKTTESEIIREGLDLVQRVRSRQANIEGLIALARGETYRKIAFEPGP